MKELMSNRERREDKGTFAKLSHPTKSKLPLRD